MFSPAERTGTALIGQRNSPQACSSTDAKIVYLRRLYTEEAYDQLFEATPPQMQRSDLAPAILQLKALGIDNVLRFNFPSSPPSKNLLAGLELLYALGAINDCGELTIPLGMTMAEMPLEPVLAKCLIVSGKASFPIDRRIIRFNT